jgi:hypothetical protein
MSFGERRKERRLEKNLTAAEERVEMAKEGQRDARSLRGMPGSKQAVKTSASQINKANREVKKAQAKLDKHQRG